MLAHITNVIYIYLFLIILWYVIWNRIFDPKHEIENVSWKKLNTSYFCQIWNFSFLLICSLFVGLILSNLPLELDIFWPNHYIVVMIKSRSSKNPGIDKSNLPQNSNFGREFVQKSGVQIPAPEGQNFLFFFLSFSNSSHKSGYLLFKSLFDILCN